MKRSLGFFIVLAGFLSACSNNLGKSDSSGTNNSGGKFFGASASLNLWRRGPSIDGGDLSINATRNLDTIGRSSVPIYDLPNLSGPLKGPYFNVYDSEASGQSTTVSEWNGRFIPWKNNVDFKLLMAFSHLSTAKRFVQGIFPDVPFRTGSLDIDRIDVFAAEPGDPFNTGYLAGGGKGILEFFASTNASIPFSSVDEADAIYHEFGHVLQHALNKSILETKGNYDMDTLLEGLSDVFAAAILRDEHILSYLHSNSGYYFQSERTGPQHTRHLNHRLSFTKGYVAQVHLDGRIIAGFANDLRKLLMGHSISLENCSTNCNVKFSAKTLTVDEAWDLTLRLTHLPLKRLVTSSTLQRYAERLYQEVAEGTDIKSLCANQASCINELKADVSLLLQARGLLSWSSFPAYNRKLKLPGESSTPELSVYSSPAFIPIGQSSGLSDSDSVIEPCEAVILLPYLKNNTDATSTRTNLYDSTVTLLSISGFTNITSTSGALLENVTGKTGSNSVTKILGWLSPGQNTSDLARSSSSVWYQTHANVGSQLAKYPSLSALPSALGWAVRAPRSGSASIRFAISTRAYNSISNTNSVTTAFTTTQSITVPTNQNNFCN